jgi:ABC-2 type transport system permease protein
MRNVVLVMRREFRERVAAKSFLIGTLLFPLLIVGLILLPRLVGASGTDWRMALVNEGPPGVGDAFAGALAELPSSPDENTYHVVRVDGRFDEIRERLNTQVTEKEIDGYVVLPADVLDGGAIQFRARNVGSFAVMRDLRRTAGRAVQTERIRAAGIDAASIAALIAPVDIEEARVGAAGEERRGARSTFWAAYIVAFLIYIMVTLYGVAVMRSVLEEKTSRIAEVLMSAIRAPHLVAGKIVGVGAAAVTQVLIWIGIVALIVTQSERFGEWFVLPDEAVQALSVQPMTGLLLFAYFVLGFFLYAAVFAMVGAAVTSEQEAQSVQFLALVPLIAPMMFLQAILNAPLGTTARTLGLIPFTAPVAMPMRMASAPIPAIEIAASLTLLVTGTAVLAWMAGKIYRVGILSTGKRPSVTELVRWLRSA